MTSIMYCRDCVVEWLGRIVKACWLCGKIGELGPYISEEGEASPWGAPASVYLSRSEAAHP
jgi:hypothetical protein